MKLLILVLAFCVFSCKTQNIVDNTWSSEVQYLYISKELSESKLLSVNGAGSYLFSDIFDEKCYGNSIGGDWKKSTKTPNEIILMYKIIETYDTLKVGKNNAYLISKKNGLKYYDVKKLPKNQNRKLDSLLAKHLVLDSIFPCIREVIVNHPPHNRIQKKNN